MVIDDVGGTADPAVIPEVPVVGSTPEVDETAGGGETTTPPVVAEEGDNVTVYNVTVEAGGTLIIGGGAIIVEGDPEALDLPEAPTVAAAGGAEEEEEEVPEEVEEEEEAPAEPVAEEAAEEPAPLTPIVLDLSNLDLSLLSDADLVALGMNPNEIPDAYRNSTVNLANVALGGMQGSCYSMDGIGFLAPSWQAALKNALTGGYATTTGMVSIDDLGITGNVPYGTSPDADGMVSAGYFSLGSSIGFLSPDSGSVGFDFIGLSTVGSASFGDLGLPATGSANFGSVGLPGPDYAFGNWDDGMGYVMGDVSNSIHILLSFGPDSEPEDTEANMASSLNSLFGYYS
jgi:hypothetical protein